jgi:hypothetical protein
MTMVLFVQKYDVHPDKTQAYNEWAKTAVPRILAAPGVVEFRGIVLLPVHHRWR